MTDTASHPTPTEINLHRKSHILTIAFSDGKRFELPCEYLRVFSRAAEVRTLGHPENGKEQVNIDRIEPQGQYAIRLVFDDGHDTGIYSWETLYELGVNQKQNWNSYLQQLEQMGYERHPEQTDGGESGERPITLLYFAYLVRKFGRESEQLNLPTGVNNVASLLEWLRKREPEKSNLLIDKHLQVTVNKQFAVSFTRLHANDEVALVPNAPTPPAGV